MKNLFPKWINELKRFQGLKSQIFLYGNIYDCYYFPTEYKNGNNTFHRYYNLPQLLESYLYTEGFEVVSTFDVIDGITVASNDKTINIENIVQKLNIKTDQQAKITNDFLKQAQNRKIEDAISFYREMVKNTHVLCAGIVNFASRITSNPNALELDATTVFLKILKAAQEAMPIVGKNGQRNILIFICDKLNDIPAWVLLDNPLAKGIEIHKPSREDRLRFIVEQQQRFFTDNQPINFEEINKLFPDLTDNFTSVELENLIAISNQEFIGLQEIKKIVDLFKYGERENPWETIDKAKINDAANILKEKVKGQPKAIEKAIEIIYRSNLGLDAIDKLEPSNRPKGVLFFAGPTGTGKTELAKSLAELIFSNKEAMIRFDMSEYNDSNSDVKLIGSPPGYVGYEEGGQLTDAIRKKPFSIVLFDEIEKAHPKVFDKFLQILDDGRLTDGKGETVYFSQSLIIFTSNLGVYKKDENGERMQNIRYGEHYDEIERKIKEEIKYFFGSQLGRPEIFNRFGDNFVVFDYIQENVAIEIILKNLNTIQTNLLKMKNIKLVFEKQFINTFLQTCALDNLENGGRGIINRIETHIKNNLTKFMFESQKLEDCEITISIQNGKITFI